MKQFLVKVTRRPINRVGMTRESLATPISLREQQVERGRDKVILLIYRLGPLLTFRLLVTASQMICMAP